MLENNPNSSNKKRGLGRGIGSLLGGAPEQAPAPAAPVAPTNQVNSQAQSLANQAAQLAKSPAQTAQVAPPQATQQTSVQPVTSQTVTTQAPIQPSVPAQDRIWKVGIDKLKSGQYQPRQDFPKEALLELSQSIKANGILQPITARKKGDSYEIIAGERRWRAAQLAGLHEVPVIIREFKDQEALELALVENIQREDLNPIEEAEAYQRLIQEFSLSQQQVAEKVGKDRATVANAVRLLSLPDECMVMIIDQLLSVGHAKVLLALNQPQKQIELAKQVINEKLSVRKLEKIVQNYLAPKEKEETKGQVDEGVMNRLISGISDELQKLLGTKVAIDYNQGKGKIAIQFYSDEEFSQTVERLKKL